MTDGDWGRSGSKPMDAALEILNRLDLLDLYALGFIALAIMVGYALTDWGLQEDD
jgi:hypothetical protein